MSAGPSTSRALDGLARVRAALDAAVIGHDTLKRALLLALVCREHVYLEGPPGAAKTRTAETLARASGLSFFYTQLHRDTRLPELLGDVVIERRPLPEGGGEQVHHRIEPGRMLTAEICLLDDISRAPGEALNVLFQVLNERRFGDLGVPLWCAIATGNPTDDAYVNEPLDPAALDRFALQLRVGSLLAGSDLEQARRLFDRFADGGPVPSAREPETAGVQREDLEMLHAQLPQVKFPDELRRCFLELLHSLVREHGCTPANSLLTDRTFLVKAVTLLRGTALLAGRDRVEAGDFETLTWMTTFRVPSAVHAELPGLVARAFGVA